MTEIIIISIIGFLVYWFLIKPKKSRVVMKKSKSTKKIHAEDAIKTILGRNLNFTSFDFETATKNPTSACSLAITVVTNGRIVETKSWLINPQIKRFNSKFIDIHGITPEKVEFEKTFKDLWPEIKGYFENQILAAHNISFDDNVLQNLLKKYKISFENYKKIDSLQWTKHFFPEFPSFSLDKIAGYLSIELDHHNPESDSLVCSKLILLCASLTDFNTISEIETTISNQRIKDNYSKTYGYSNFIIAYDVTISFTSNNLKSKSYNDAVNFVKSLNETKFEDSNDLKIYTTIISTKDESDLRYLLTLTTNWKSRKIIINDREIKQSELTSALWFSKLTLGEVENSEHISRVEILKRGKNMEYLINLFEKIRQPIE